MLRIVKVRAWFFSALRRFLPAGLAKGSSRAEFSRNALERSRIRRSRSTTDEKSGGFAGAIRTREEWVGVARRRGTTKIRATLRGVGESGDPNLAPIMHGREGCAEWASRWRLRLGLGLLAVAAGGIVAGRHEVLEKRVRVVEEGGLVRGAWQRPGPLRRIIRREGIRTIVTLTAINRDDPKYRGPGEGGASGRHGVDHRADARVEGDAGADGGGGGLAGGPRAASRLLPLRRRAPSDQPGPCGVPDPP